MPIPIWELLPEDEPEWQEGDSWYPQGSNRNQPHCPCGRFAKYLGGRHYYNGNYDCYSFDVDCSRCGVVTTECV